MSISLWKIGLFACAVIVISYLVFPGTRQLGEMYMADYEYSKAEPYLYKAIEENPRDAKALKNLAYYKSVLGETEEVIEIYEKIVALLPDNADNRYYLAKLYSWNNRPFDELKQLEVIEKITPRDPKLLVRLIDFYHWQVQYDKAIPILERLVKLEPRNPEHYVTLADDYIHLKKYNEAMAVYQVLTKRYKKDIKYHLVLSDIYEWQELYDKSIEVLIKALAVKWRRKVEAPPQLKLTEKLDEESREVLEHLGLLYFGMKKYDKVLDIYAKVLEVEPRNYDFREDYATYFRWLDRNPDALQQYLILVQQRPNNIEYFAEISDIYLALGQLDKAERYLKKILIFDPYHLPTLVSLTNVYFYMEKPEKAIPILDAVLEKKKDDPDILTLIAEAYIYSGRNQSAIQVYEHLLKKFPGNERYLRNLADAYLYVEQPQKSIDIYLELLKKNPKNYNVLKQLGEAYLASEMPTKAVPVFQKLVKRYPNFQKFRKRLGESYIYSGNFQKGINILKKHLAQDPYDAETCHLISIAYQGVGEEREVRFYLKKTLTILRIKKERGKEPTKQGVRETAGFQKREELKKVSGLERANQERVRKEEERKYNLLKVQVLKELGETIAAVQIMDRLYPDYKNDREFLLVYSNSLMEVGQFEKAYQVLQGPSLQPERPEVYSAMAALYDTVDDPYSASRYHHMALAYKPGDKATLTFLADDYELLGDPLEAIHRYEDLVQEYPNDTTLRQRLEWLKLTYGPKLTSTLYSNELVTGDMTRYLNEHFEQYIIERLQILVDLRLGHYRDKPVHIYEDDEININEKIMTLTTEAKWQWEPHVFTAAGFKQFYGGPKDAVFGWTLSQDFAFFTDRDYRMDLSFDMTLHDLWLNPIPVIPFKGTQNIYDVSFSQEILNNYVTLNASAGIQDSFLGNGGKGREKTFEGKVGVRVLKGNPKFVVSYRYFRDSPTIETREDPELAAATSIASIRQNHYIVDLQYSLPNRLLLFGSTTWSGHKDQRSSDIFQEERSLVGWSAGFTWPLTTTCQMTFNFGNTGAGSEGGIATKRAKTYLGQIEMKFL